MPANGPTEQQQQQEPPSGGGLAQQPAGSIYLVGAGRLGAALARAIVDSKLPLLGLWTRSAASASRASAVSGRDCAHGPLPAEIARAEVVLIAVPDAAIAATAGALLDGGLLHRGAVVLHCSGSIPAAEALAGLGASLPKGTFHPLLAVAEPSRAASRLRGAAVGIEGDPEALQRARALALRLGARPLALRAGLMPLYHAAAVLASNHAVALWQVARQLLVSAGIDALDAHVALLPLLESTLENFMMSGADQALTGPARRGDVPTVARHLEALGRAAPELLPLYRAATAAALSLAARMERPPVREAVAAIEALLAQAPAGAPER